MRARDRDDPPQDGAGSLRGRGRIGAAIVLTVAFATVVAMAVRLGGSGAAEGAGPGGGDARPVVDVFQVPDGGYGYRISTEDGIVIHQPYVPAVPGKTGFASAEDARRVAALVVRRIESATSLPAVSREDLDSLGVATLGRESATTGGKELPPATESPRFSKEGS